MNDTLRRGYFVILNSYSKWSFTVSAIGFGFRVLVQHGRNSQRIPRAVSPVCPTFGLHRISGRYSGKRMGHPDVGCVRSER